MKDVLVACSVCHRAFFDSSTRKPRKFCAGCTPIGKSAKRWRESHPERVERYNRDRRDAWVAAPPRTIICGDCSVSFESQGVGNGKRQFCDTCSRDRDTARHAHRKRFEQKGDLDPGTVARMKNQATKCPLCDSRMTDSLGPRKKHLDHIIPRAAGGMHTLTNVRVICATCNISRPYDASDLAQLPLGAV